MIENDIEQLLNQAKSSTGYSGAPVGYVSAQSVPLLLEAILLKLTQIHDYQVNAGAPVEHIEAPVESEGLSGATPVGHTERVCANCQLPITTGQPYVNGPLNAMGYYLAYHADCTDD